MKCYAWVMLVVMSNVYASEVILHSQIATMQEQRTFECFETHWGNGSKGFPILDREFKEDFDFTREFTYGDTTGTLLQIAAKLNDQNGIRSLFLCPGGIRDREYLLKDREYIKAVFSFEHVSLDMVKFLSGPGFFDLEMAKKADPDLYYKTHTLRGFYDPEKNEFYFKLVRIEK